LSSSTGPPKSASAGHQVCKDGDYFFVAVRSLCRPVYIHTRIMKVSFVPSHAKPRKVKINPNCVAWCRAIWLDIKFIIHVNRSFTYLSAVPILRGQCFT
jgi:hypothetical protein